MSGALADYSRPSGFLRLTNLEQRPASEDFLTEINVTCPTGVRQIKELGGPDIAKLFWDNINS